eukprot:Clim_evm4s57 gene=Clim_evmTU4s57
MSVSFASISLFTTKFNDFFVRTATAAPKASRLYFDLGILTALVISVSSVVVLALNLFYTFSPVRVEAEDGSVDIEESAQFLTPVVPGVNLPVSHLGYYFFALALAGVLHEMGHAIAAATEGVVVEGFGVFLALMYPGAYVELDGSHVEKLHPWNQLRIYTAGVWHNVLISIAALVLLALSPYFFVPLYGSGHGAVVVELPRQSPMFSVMKVGDRVVSIDSGACDITGADQWIDCLLRMRNKVHNGYCVSQEGSHSGEYETLEAGTTLLDPAEFVRDDDGSLDCCDRALIDHGDFRESRLCFHNRRAVDEKDNDDSVGDDGDAEEVQADDGHRYTETNHSCLPVRKVINSKRCDEHKDCGQVGHECFFPNIPPAPVQLLMLDYVPSKRHAGFLGEFHAAEAGEDRKHLPPPAIFFGDPLELIHTIGMSDFIPKTGVFSASFPMHWTLTLRYTLSLSGALALLNIVPAYFLDGQYTVAAALRILIPHNDFWRILIARVILFVGSGLMVANMAAALISLGE